MFKCIIRHWKYNFTSLYKTGNLVEIFSLVLVKQTNKQKLTMSVVWEYDFFLNAIEG